VTLAALAVLLVVLAEMIVMTLMYQSVSCPQRQAQPLQQRALLLTAALTLTATASLTLLLLAVLVLLLVLLLMLLRATASH
jgi:hypothetical protein